MGPLQSPQQSVSAARERLLTELAEELRGLDANQLRRHMIRLESIRGPLVRIGGRELVSWCSNDYLGLSAHPRLIQAAERAGAEWGIGARASRLLAGTTRWHVLLEERLAAWFGAEAAVVYPSGYQANLGTLGCLFGSRDVLVIDRLAHASLFEAARATRARLRVFRHHDVSHAATLLAGAAGARRRCLITEGVFSMEGDRAPLATLVDVARAHEALVYVDDAHGAFVLGATGRGTPEASGVALEHVLYLGTLGKALGCQGGFVVGPQALIEFLRNRAKPFVYTTALAVPVAAAAVAALEVLGQEPQRRALLWTRAGELWARLEPRRSGLPTGAASHIAPLVVGETAQALALARRLWDDGIWAPAIRPPTVPDGTARIRFSVTVLHTEAHMDALVRALDEGLAAIRPS